MKIFPVTKNRFLFGALLSVVGSTARAADVDWWPNVLRSVLPADQAQEIVAADDAAENMPPRRVFVRNVYRIREKYGEEIKKVREQYNEALEQAKKGAKWNWVRGCDSFREQMDALCDVYHKSGLLSDLEKDESIKNRLDAVYYQATDNCPSVTVKQVLVGRLYDLSERLERMLRAKLKDLEEKEARFLKKLKTLEDYINFIYPKAPSIPVSPVSDWKNILYAKFDEEISSILKSCYVEVEQIPPQIRNFLEQCGYKTSDKVVIFSSLKALETLPLTDEQLQNYKNLIQNKDARKKFIHNFWHDENRVQFELDVLKQPDGPTKVQAALDSFVQSLQSLAEDPYWGDYIIYLHAVLEAPATRLRRLKHLIFSLLNEEYTPYRNEVEFQCVFDAYSRFLGNTKIIASPTSATPGDSTRGILTMTVMEAEIHELKHLGDPLIQSEFWKTLISGVNCDQTLSEVVSRLYTVQYDGTQFESYLLRNYSNAIREDAKTAQSNPNGRWPERTASEVAWRSADEFWNVMGLRSLKYLQYRVFCFNPFSDNVYYSQKSKTLRDIYPYKGAYPASINWAEPLDLNLYKGYLDGVQDLFRQLNAKT